MDNQKSKTNYLLLQILNITGFLVMVIVNFLANYLPINGLTTGEVAALYPNLFTPAGFTFLIWGFIYLLLAIFVYVQAKGILARNREFGYVKRIGYLFFTSCLLNAAWIFAWHYLMVATSLVIMVLLLINLISIYNSLKNSNIQTETGFRVTRVAFSVYLGWITIATVANVTALLVHLNWNRFGLSEVFWMITVMFISTIIVVSFILKNRDGVYGLVAIWAFIGIIYKRLTVEPVLFSVVVVTFICIVIIGYFSFKALTSKII